MSFWSKLKPVLAIAAVALAVPVLQGCVGTVVGAGATAGTAAMEERGIAGAVDDTAIRLRVNALLSNKDERLWRTVGLKVHSGAVCETSLLRSRGMEASAAAAPRAADRRAGHTGNAGRGREVGLEGRRCERGHQRNRGCGIGRVDRLWPRYMDFDPAKIGAAVRQACVVHQLFHQNCPRHRLSDRDRAKPRGTRPGDKSRALSGLCPESGEPCEDQKATNLNFISYP